MSQNSAIPPRSLSLSQYPGVQRSLADRGLDMLEALPLSSLPLKQLELLPDRLRTEACVLLIGNSGSAFWRDLVDTRAGNTPQVADFEQGITIQSAAPSVQLDAMETDPVDSHALQCVTGVLLGVIDDRDFYALFPAQEGSVLLPLQQLGSLVGWHQPSPLGIGIHREKGLWFAYRAVVVVSADKALVKSIQQRFNSDLSQVDDARPADSVNKTSGLSSTCGECRGQPCLSTCPADALASNRPPEMDKCIAYRRQSGSRCASTCIARLACPVGTDFRYPEQQITYHYEYSMRSIKRDPFPALL